MEQRGEHSQEIIALELALDMDRQALAGVLVEHRQHAVRFAIMHAVHDEVVAPTVPGVLRSQAHKSSIVEPKTTALELSLR